MSVVRFLLVSMAFWSLQVQDRAQAENKMKVTLKSAPEKVTKTAKKEKAKIPARHSTDVFHVVKDNETVWFIAEIYYGKGLDFEKILSANNMKSSTELKTGEKIVVPEPRYLPDHTGFKQRYESLAKARERKLAEKGSTSMTGKEILKQLKLQTTEKKDSAKSPPKETPFRQATKELEAL
jgi:hypothetical protein